MNNSIQTFTDSRFGNVRTLTEEGEARFCLPDLCQILDLTPSKVAQRLDKDVLYKYPLDTAGGTQVVNFVNEDGVYDVILDSRKPEARKFRKWITSEVLPAIRKTGGYLIAKQGETPESLMARALLVANDTLNRERQKLQMAQTKISEDAPKVLFADAVSMSKGSCLVSTLAKILSQNGINIGEKRLYRWLRENGYLCTKGQYYNKPTQRSMNMKLFEVAEVTISRPSGTILSATTYVTPKGIQYFVDLFLRQQIAQN